MLARIFGALAFGQWTQQDIQVPIPEQLRWRIRVTIESKVSHQLIHQVKTNLFVRLLAPAKAQLDADFHVLAQEADGMLSLGCEVMRINRRRNLDFF
jgi:hypothetical protein